MVNPYLMGLALLKAFDHGITDNLDPGEAEERNIYEAIEAGKQVTKLPMSLGILLERLAAPIVKITVQTSCIRPLGMDGRPAYSVRRSGLRIVPSSVADKPRESSPTGAQAQSLRRRSAGERDRRSGLRTPHKPTLGAGSNATRPRVVRGRRQPAPGR